MKRILFTLTALLAMSTGAWSQTQMHVKLFDGSVLNLYISEIEEITWDEGEGSGTDNDPDQPTVTGDATDIAFYTATITGYANNILDNESTDLRVGIIYCTEGTPNRSNGTQRSVSLSSIGEDGKYSLQLTGLQEGTTYYYRSYVYQSGLWFYGKVREFRTRALSDNITFQTGSATAITCFSAKVSGQFVIDGGMDYSSLSWGICYGTTSEPTDKVGVSTRDAQGNFTATLRALAGSTIYYYRPYVTIDGRTFYGQTSSFQTKADNVCQTGDADDEWNVSSLLTIGGGSYSKLELGVCYSRDSDQPTVSDRRVSTIDVDDDGRFTVQLPIGGWVGTWYYRAYVLIDGSAHYGAVKEKIQQGDNPQTFTVNGVSFTMVPIEGGKFTMGATSEQQNPESNEKPTHSVTLSSYMMGETEVTQGLWQAVMGYTPTSDGTQWSSGYGMGTQYPAYYISWYDVLQFIAKLNQLTGKTFRMPTEAEWEYAARGGSKSRGYQYSGSDNLGDVAWYSSNSGSKTHPVKTKSPNELGLYDMSGNVWEWCSDWFGSYSSDAQTNPTGPSNGFYRVFRGGSWGCIARGCRVAYRIYNSPSYCDGDLGFRLAL